MLDVTALPALISTPRVGLSLELLEEKDVHIYNRWFTDPKVTRYLDLENLFLSAKAQKIDIGTAFFKSNQMSTSRRYWKLVANSHNIGHLGLKHIKYSLRTAEISCVIGETEYWGRHFASDAVKGLINHLQTIKWSSLVAIVKEGNVASMRLWEQNGFTKEQQGKEFVFRKTF